METVSNLLVLKESSRQIAHQTQDGTWDIDHDNIANHAQQANEFLEENTDWGLVIVCSAARKLLGYNAWNNVVETWGDNFERTTTSYELTTDHFSPKVGLRLVFDLGVKEGEVVLVNGRNRQTRSDQRFQNGDYLASDVAGMALRRTLFKTVELGMFTNVGGLLRNNRVVRRVDDMYQARILTHYGHTEDDTSGTIGGVETKLEAISQAHAEGVTKAWIANGRVRDALRLARAGEIGTTFVRKEVCECNA
jgi:hypothetical protein